MEKSKLCESYVRVESDEASFEVIDENHCGNDIGYSSDGIIESVHFHQLPGSTVCVSDDSAAASITEEGTAAAAVCCESTVKSNDSKTAEKTVEKKAYYDSTINAIKLLSKRNGELETELTVANRTLKSSLSQLESQKIAFDELKKALEAELQKKKEESEQLKKENAKLFDKIVEYEKSNDKNVLRSLTDAATEMDAVEGETENAKLLKDENAKMNRSVERLRNDFVENSLYEKYDNELQILRSDNKSKQDMINELKNKLEDVQCLTEQLAPVLDEFVKEREAKESALKIVKHLEKEQKKSLEIIENLEVENKELLEVAESFVELSTQISQSVMDSKEPSNKQINEKYMCLQCWKHFKNMREVKMHDGSCSSGFDAYF